MGKIIQRRVRKKFHRILMIQNMMKDIILEIIYTVFQRILMIRKIFQTVLMIASDPELDLRMNLIICDSEIFALLLLFGLLLLHIMFFSSLFSSIKSSNSTSELNVHVCRKTCWYERDDGLSI